MVTQVVPQLNLTKRMLPIVRELPADLETPVSIYLKLAGKGPSFLLESVTGGEQVARYSFIGVHPSRAFVFRKGQVRVFDPQDGLSKIEDIPLSDKQDPLEVLREVLAENSTAPVYGLPRFTGGLVGYLGYELVRYFEPSVNLEPPAQLPEAIFLQADTLVALDHAFGRLVLIGNARVDGSPGRTPDEVEATFDEIERRLAMPMPDPLPASPKVAGLSRANLTRSEFIRSVQSALEHIAAGDIFQVVLSQRLDRQTNAVPFDIYRALRRLNPSPYMFYFDFGDLAGEEPLRLIGASPEMHARLEGRTACVRPIAGTRPRGKSPSEEAALEADLLADPKERAEHIMLVDLGRNDLGRICEYGSVRVPEQMVIERYSHVIHLVSHVEGQLRPELDAIDLFRATFPAGTVSGAPKIRAMQIIDDLETSPRGPYAGAVGYFSYDGSMDTCITIRTLVMQGQTVRMQAGAGIVADSQAENEYRETQNKLQALAVAVEQAEAKGAGL
jgi:anthranilate synthase component 1